MNYASAKSGEVRGIRHFFSFLSYYNMVTWRPQFLNVSPRFTKHTINISNLVAHLRSIIIDLK